MGRPSNTAERRGQIVQGLRQVMAEQGYERASVADVARAAGLTPGLVHYHFKDKQEILLGLIEQLSEEATARIQRKLMKAGADPTDRLDAFVDAYLAVDEEADPSAVACWVAIGAEAIRQPKVGKAYQRVVDANVDQLRLLFQEALGGRSEALSGAAAAGLFASILGYFTLAVASPEAVPRGSAAKTARRMARALLEQARAGGRS